MEITSHADRRRKRGDAKRRVILDRAVDLVVAQGMDGMSLASLAADLGISKSGVVLHFGSKLDLQLAVIERAKEQFLDNVVAPAEAEPEGLLRLWALCTAWLRFIEVSIRKGGCFFSALDAEYANRPGPIHDAVARAHRGWTDLLYTQAAAAARTGELRPGVDPVRLAFECDAFMREAMVWHQLRNDDDAFEYARGALRDRLNDCRATDPPAA